MVDATTTLKDAEGLQHERVPVRSLLTHPFTVRIEVGKRQERRCGHPFDHRQQPGQDLTHEYNERDQVYASGEVLPVSRLFAAIWAA
jgi:hypothetical protein